MDFYNDFEPFACEWLGNLIAAKELPQGDVDGRSIKEIKGSELGKYRSCHFFAGIGGWPYAFRLAGWPIDDVPVWSGSCPCQPYSNAGKRKGNADERNLWPDFFRLIRECRPQYVFGEQVPGSIGHGWLDGISADLEEEGYAVGSCVLGAHSVGSPHIRQRLFWIAYSRQFAPRGVQRTNGNASTKRTSQAVDDPRCCKNGGMGDSSRTTSEWYARSVFESKKEGGGERIGDGDCFVGPTDAGDSVCGMANLQSTRCGRQVAEKRRFDFGSNWDDCRIIDCRDGKSRRVGSRVSPLAHGLSRKLGQRIPELRSVLPSARNNRTGRLKGYGNAINPYVAAVFIRAFMETQ